LGIVTTSSETALARAPETSYDFVTKPANWPKTCPGSAHITRAIARELDTPDAGNG
jgi:hypothetical protein